MIDEGYVNIKGFCTPSYSYLEGDKGESYWVDSINCMMHTIDNDDVESCLRRDGRNY